MTTLGGGAAKTLLVDCDPGVDDAVMLLYLLADPTVEICGITTVLGNVDAPVAARNALAVLDIAGRPDIPVSVGARRRLLGAPPDLALHVHGPNGLGGVPLAEARSRVTGQTAVEFLLRTVRSRPGQIHLLATGPLTNVATALAVEPDLTELVAGVTIMGGAVHAPGNVTPVAESNIANDPEAAHRVLTAPWDVTMVPLDVTMREVLTEEQRQRLAVAGNPQARFAAEILTFYFDHYERVLGRRGSACHDVLAAAVAVGDVTPVRAVTTFAQVDTSSGPARGATICDTRGLYRGQASEPGGRCRVILETDGTFPEQLTQRLVGA